MSSVEVSDITQRIVTDRDAKKNFEKKVLWLNNFKEQD